MNNAPSYEEILCELITPVKWPEFERDRLMRRAKQIPRVVTNPATLRSSMDDMPVCGEFVD